jgi:uncharacterized protein involved in copper resistance
VKDTVGARLYAALGCRSMAAGVYRRLNPAPHRGAFCRAEREDIERKYAAYIGRAFGHAFRAADIAYDAGHRQGEDLVWRALRAREIRT